MIDMNQVGESDRQMDNHLSTPQLSSRAEASACGLGITTRRIVNRPSRRSGCAQRNTGHESDTWRIERGDPNATIAIIQAAANTARCPAVAAGIDHFQDQLPDIPSTVPDRRGRNVDFLPVNTLQHRSFPGVIHRMQGLTKPEIYNVVNRYIGVKDGYLGDFSYRTHFDFYPEYCDLDIDPNSIPGTTRERFIQILSTSSPDVQARILTGVLKKYPVGSASPRTPERRAEILTLIARLEGSTAVSSPTLRTTSAVVERAIRDAETLLNTTGATSGVDRVHTALHGYLLLVCDEAGIPHGSDPTLTALYTLVRSQHPALTVSASHADEIARILKAFTVILDALNMLRNRASVAHPNPVLLAPDEALLAINAARTLLHYLDAKISA